MMAPVCPNHRFRHFAGLLGLTLRNRAILLLYLLLAYYLLTTCLLLSILNPRPEERRLLPKSSRPRALPLHAKAQTTSY